MTQLDLTGSVTTADGDLPVAGVTVIAAAATSMTDRPRSDQPCDTTELGRAITDAHGAFTIRTHDDGAAARYVCAMRGCPDFTFHYVCLDSNGNVMHRSVQLSYREGMVSSLLLPESKHTPSKEDWRAVSERIVSAQILRFGDAVTELATLAPEGVFRDWDVAHRLAVLQHFEQALLDPAEELVREIPVRFGLLTDIEYVERQRERFHAAGHDDLVSALNTAAARANTLGTLQTVASYLDSDALYSGDVITGVHRFDGFTAVIPDNQFPWLTSPLRGYRDYLRDRWVANQRFTRGFGDLKDTQLCSAAVMCDRLTARFHQDFTTSDTHNRPANEVVIGIMTDILTAPEATGYGFGIPAGTVDPQGDRSHRDYLDYLIAKTELDDTELENRYRLNLRRPDTEMSNPVQQNIETLQRFFTDSYQSDDDPSIVKPDRKQDTGERLIPQFFEVAAGPFFLEYEEWLAKQEPFYPENYYDPRATYRWEIGERLAPIRKLVFDNSLPLAEFAVTAKNANLLTNKAAAKWQWVRNHIDLYDLITSANDNARAMNYPRAEQEYTTAMGYADYLRGHVTADWDYNPKVFAKAQRTSDVSSMEKLRVYEGKYIIRLGEYHDPGTNSQISDLMPGNTEIGDKWWGLQAGTIDWPGNRRELAYLFDYLLYRYLPACLSEVQLALGKYAEAVRLLVEPAGFAVYAADADFNPYSGTVNGVFTHSQVGELPYATSSERSVVPAADPVTKRPTNKAEKGYFKLKLGTHMLEWADVLYRSNEPDRIMRARELYKGVLYLHGEDPEISPLWPGGIPIPPSLKFSLRRNPADVGQINRARIGFLQINAGLNYYGVGPKHVPPVRFRVLQEAAVRFAAGARGAQTDFLDYMRQLDQLTVSEMTARTMVQKGTAALEIAKEQQQIAEYAVGEAERQVAAVQAQIAAKKAEIADHESVFNQFKDFAAGMKDSIGKLASVAFAGESDPGAAEVSKVSTGDLFKFATKLGAVSDAGGAASVFGSAGAVAGPFAAFIYAGVTSIVSLADAVNKRDAELNTLQTVALPAAQAIVTLKKRDVTITQLAQTVAQADVELGGDLLAYYSTRYLNRSFLISMADFSNRLMRRYLDLAGRTGWLAERALSFEQDRELGIISFDYYPRGVLGVSGADLLQLHLAELEAARIQGLTQTIPIKHTISLARDFPLAFGQLKKNGVCAFTTSEAPLHLMHPGAYGYRVRNVTIAATYTEPIRPHRGMLLNRGISAVSSNTPNRSHLLVRYPDALPLSDFRMENDMWVFGLPDETLLPFEGSGIETAWNLVLPADGNTGDLEAMTDFILTFDMRAKYSAVLEQNHLANVVHDTHRSVLLSGKALNPGAIAKFREDGGALHLDFELAALTSNPHETAKKATNLALIVCGITNEPVNATVSSGNPMQDQAVVLDNGIALSNAGVLAGNGAVALPLNTFVGTDIDQRFTASIDAADNPGIDLSKINDVMLLVDYETTLV